MKREFFRRTFTACADAGLAQKLKTATGRQLAAREKILTELDDVEKFRELAAAVRDDALANLDEVLSRFTERAQAFGVHVHWAEDAMEACRIIRDVARSHDVESIVKSKSMLTEEIELTPFLIREGIEVTETDLGEFIIQLADQRPSHIVIPALHMSALEVADIFGEKIGYDGEADPERLTKAAREHLRGKFKSARMGVSGVNLACAREGYWLVCTNEGNGRYVMGAPEVYLGVMGIERIVRDAAAGAVILKLLAKFATGQRITQYVNAAGGPCDADGPRHVHLVILDNGRSRILGTKYWRMLRCIRCGACLNVCPPFKYIGGQVFPGCYSGPMGAVLLPLQKGLEEAGLPAKACSLCGLCEEVCPVKIPLPEFMLELRNEMTHVGRGGMMERVHMNLGSWIFRHPMLYRLAQRAARLGLKWVSREGWVSWLPSLPGRWTDVKDFPLPAKRSFLRERRAGRGKGDG